MNELRLWDEDALEKMMPIFNKTCSERGYEGVIFTVDAEGCMKVFHTNPESGFIRLVPTTTLLSTLVGKDVSSRHGSVRRANTHSGRVSNGPEHGGSREKEGNAPSRQPRTCHDSER
jgi:hypothetical protein